MGVLPIRVLLFSGGEPSFFNGIEHCERLGESPFIRIDTADILPSFQDLESGRWQLCLLPCEAYLSISAFPPGLPVIVYGPSSLALTCLEAGASDFMRPGWSWLELEARLFRYWSLELVGDIAVYRLWGLVLVRLSAFPVGDASNPLSRAETGLELSPKEAAALRLLAYRSGKVLPYSALIAASVGGSKTSRSNPRAAAAMMISRLRKKLASLDPGLARSLRSACGQGYLWINMRIHEN